MHVTVLYAFQGYSLIEYKTYDEALKAKESLDESTLLDRQIAVNWAFIQKPPKFEKPVSFTKT